MVRISEHFQVRLKNRFQMNVKELKDQWKELEKIQIRFRDKNSENQNQRWFKRLKDPGDYVVLIKELNMVIIHRGQTWTTCFRLI